MPDNFSAALATFSAVAIGANYTSIFKMFGCCGVSILTGPPGSCKSEALICALSMAHTNLQQPNHAIISVKNSQQDDDSDVCRCH